MLNRLSYHIDEALREGKIDYDVYLNLREMSDQLGDETFVVQCPNCGCLVNCMVEPIPFTEVEARVAELKGGKE